MFFRDFDWILPGELAVSSFPGNKSSLEWFNEKGIKAIVSLSLKPLPHEWIETLGFKYLHLPTIDFHPIPLRDIEQFIDFTDDCLDNGKPVLVHCMAGLGRSGTMVSCYLVKRKGMSTQKAIYFVKVIRPGSVDCIEFVETIMNFEAQINS